MNYHDVFFNIDWFSWNWKGLMKFDVWINKSTALNLGGPKPEFSSANKNVDILVIGKWYLEWQSIPKSYYFRGSY